jgi:murein L,D-transpeptidase YafK
LRGKSIRFAIVASLVPVLGVTSLAGCSMLLDDTESILRMGTVRTSTLKRIESLNMDREAPVLIRIYKEESALEVWKQDRTGRFALLIAYPVCRYSGKLGPKVSEGDRQAPEGFHDVTPEQMNPLSREYLDFNIGFPNAFDRSLGRTGSLLMVHGGCKSIGCYAMTDSAMGEFMLSSARRSTGDKPRFNCRPFHSA